MFGAGDCAIATWLPIDRIAISAAARSASAAARSPRPRDLFFICRVSFGCLGVSDFSVYRRRGADPIAGLSSVDRQGERRGGPSCPHGGNPLVVAVRETAFE